MTHLIHLTTAKFDVTQEEPNPYNPIAGQGLVFWLGEELKKTGWQATKPDAEDWGWYIIVQKNGTQYLIGGHGEIIDNQPPTDWMIQIQKQRTLLQKLTGKNNLSDHDPLTCEIENIVRHAPAITKVSIDKNG